MSNITVGARIPTIPPNGLAGHESTAVNRPVKALVLSSGGLFAAHQAGVYKALWPYWTPELIGGVSAGALNGWMVAARVHPDELIERWLHPDAGTTIRIRSRPSLRGGY